MKKYSFISIIKMKKLLDEIIEYCKYVLSNLLKCVDNA